MAKQHRYPRKLRQTLEKLAAGREEREKIAPDNKSDEIPDEFRPMWHHFLAGEDIALGHTLLDQANRKIITTMWLEKPVHHPSVGIMAPWLLSEPPSP